jgi:hypothetical protein
MGRAPDAYERRQNHKKKYSRPNQTEQEEVEDLTYDGKMVLTRT